MTPRVRIKGYFAETIRRERLLMTVRQVSQPNVLRILNRVLTDDERRVIVLRWHGFWLREVSMKLSMTCASRAKTVSTLGIGRIEDRAYKKLCSQAVIREFEKFAATAPTSL